MLSPLHIPQEVVKLPFHHYIFHPITIINPQFRSSHDKDFFSAYFDTKSKVSNNNHQNKNIKNTSIRMSSSTSENNDLILMECIFCLDTIMKIGANGERSVSWRYSFGFKIL